MTFGLLRRLLDLIHGVVHGWANGVKTDSSRGGNWSYSGAGLDSLSLDVTSAQLDRVRREIC